ncbi:MAG TPA: sugar phosphate nucleotidyltransferase [Gaiellales bacterium]
MTSRAIILAGGLGTRLRPYTHVLPKPLVPIGDRPVLDIIVNQLRHYGFDRITVATGYMAELIEAFFGDGSSYGIPIDYVREHEPLGTAGALAMVEELDEDFLVINGDTLTDMDYSAVLQHHSESDAIATIATRTREVEISLGVLRLEDRFQPDRVTDYVEKPRIEYSASMGAYCFSPRVRDFVERGVRLDFPDLILRLIARGERVEGHRSEDYWMDIGSHGDYERAVEDFERMRARLLPGSTPAVTEQVQRPA